MPKLKTLLGSEKTKKTDPEQSIPKLKTLQGSEKTEKNSAHEECSTERFRKVPAGHTLLWRQGDDLNADPLTAPPFPSRLIHQSAPSS